MSSALEPVYWGVSWLLLRIHELWDMVLPGRRILSTDWDWILAIVGLAVAVRILLVPLFVLQVRSQRRLRTIAPRLRELQTKHKGDPQTLREEVMRLYQAEKVNPIMGCLPLILQATIFIGVFHVLRMPNPLAVQPYSDVPKTLYGWTVAQFDSAASAQLFGAPVTATVTTGVSRVAALGGADVSAVRVVAAALVLLMTLIAYGSSRLTVAASSGPSSERDRSLTFTTYVVPVAVLAVGLALPIGAALYWVVQAVIGLALRWRLLDESPVATIPA
jgi:YidC/Oxa1 family membrane protein insertase